jgi:hypothetical protein
LDTIKNFFYKIAGPIEVYSELIRQYMSSKTLYSSKDDLLFILNTSKESLQNVKADDFDHTDTNTLYVFKDDANNYADNTLTVESVTITMMGMILINMFSLVFSKSPPYININVGEFTSMFDKYLKKKFPETSQTSVIVFALDPNNSPSIP